MRGHQPAVVIVAANVTVCGSWHLRARAAEGRALCGVLAWHCCIPTISTFTLHLPRKPVHMDSEILGSLGLQRCLGKWVLGTSVSHFNWNLLNCFICINDSLQNTLTIIFSLVFTTTIQSSFSPIFRDEKAEIQRG